MEQEKDYYISPIHLSLKLDGCSTIENVDKFIASHERFVANLKPGKARIAYKTRLNQVKQLIIEQNDHKGNTEANRG